MFKSARLELIENEPYLCGDRLGNVVGGGQTSLICRLLPVMIQVHLAGRGQVGLELPI